MNKKIILPVILLLLSLAILFDLREIVVLAALFTISLVIMMKFGSHIALDVDPTPFLTLVLLKLFDYQLAVIYLAVSVFIIDAVTGRFSHFTLINFTISIITILIFVFTPLKGLELYLGIVLFNILRMLVFIALKLGLESVIYSIIHALIYFLIGSVVSIII